MVTDFVATRHRELVAHIDERIRESRARLRAVMSAGQRLGAFGARAHPPTGRPPSRTLGTAPRQRGGPP